MRCLWFFVGLFPALISAETWSFQARAGYFLPAAKSMREVYKSGGIEPEVEGAVCVYKQLDAWVNFNAFFRNGHSQGLGDTTSIQLYPLSAGFKYKIKLVGSLNMYLGIGPSLTWVRIHDHSSYVQQHISKTAWGVVGKSGFTYHYMTHAFIDLFADYYYGKVSALSQNGVESDSLNVGGLRAGLGLGISF